MDHGLWHSSERRPVLHLPYLTPALPTQGNYNPESWVHYFFALLLWYMNHVCVVLKEIILVLVVLTLLWLLQRRNETFYFL